MYQLIRKIVFMVMSFKYAVPFPFLNKKEDNEVVLQFYEHFKGKIEFIYVGLSHLDLYNGYIDSDYENKCTDFLNKSLGKYKRVLYISPHVITFSKNHLLTYIIHRIYPVIDKYKFDGIFCWNFNMACCIRRHFPNIKIYLYPGVFVDIKDMAFWNKYAGVDAFTFTSDYLRYVKSRDLNLLNYDILIVVNEKCSLKCNLSNKFGKNSSLYGFCLNCGINDYHNIILPMEINSFEKSEGNFVWFISAYMKDFNWFRTVFLSYVTGKFISSLSDVINQ